MSLTGEDPFGVDEGNAHSPPQTRSLDFRSASDEHFLRVYRELKEVASRQLANERKGHTLTATALVHEAYMRVVGKREVEWAGAEHFFCAAAEAMRRILIEHARARGRIKRGSGAKRAPMNVLDLAADTDSEDVMMLDEAVRRLEQEDERAAVTVRLRFYAGLGADEVAKVLGVSPSTVDRDWVFARAWLHRAIIDSNS